MNLIDEMFGDGSLEFLQDHPMAVSVVRARIMEMRRNSVYDDPKQMQKVCVYCEEFITHKKDCKKYIK